MTEVRPPFKPGGDDVVDPRISQLLQEIDLMATRFMQDVSAHLISEKEAATRPRFRPELAAALLHIQAMRGHGQRIAERYRELDNLLSGLELQMEEKLR